jgi:hypothetical protein
VRSNGRDSRTAATIAARPLIISRHEIAIAIISMRSSRRSFSLLAVGCEEASELDVRSCGSALGCLPVGKICVFQPKIIRARLRAPEVESDAEREYGSRAMLRIDQHLLLRLRNKPVTIVLTSPSFLDSEMDFVRARVANAKQGAVPK